MNEIDHIPLNYMRAGGSCWYYVILLTGDIRLRAYNNLIESGRSKETYERWGYYDMIPIMEYNFNKASPELRGLFTVVDKNNNDEVLFELTDEKHIAYIMAKNITQ